MYEGIRLKQVEKREQQPIDVNVSLLEVACNSATSPLQTPSFSLDCMDGVCLTRSGMAFHSIFDSGRLFRFIESDRVVSC